MSGDNRTSSDLGGAPGGMGASTGEDPRGPSVGGGGQGEDRSFEPKAPGRTAPEGEGGGTMSGRGQEHGTGVEGQGGDHLMGRSGGQPQERTEAQRPEQHLGEDSGALSGTGSIGGGAAGGGRGTSGGVTGPGAGDMAATTDGRAGDAGAGANETSGPGANSTGGTGADASGDAHLGQDGRKLGDPMNAQRQVPSDGANNGLANGSGAD